MLLFTCDILYKIMFIVFWMLFSGDGRMLEVTPDIESDELVGGYNCTVDFS